MNPLSLNAYRWFLMLGGVLLLVSGVFGLVFNKGGEDSYCRPDRSRS